ncbi:MAG: type VI secretion system-associated FHA domain protein TagH [Pseudorhodobacter sp.]
MPVTLRFQSSGTIPGDVAPITMQGPSLTIGRTEDNDVVLPDPERIISKNHCAIEDDNGDVTVIDFSANGTFLNEFRNPLGRVRTPLNDGDVLKIGTYELVIMITPAEGMRDPVSSLPPPVDEEQVSHGDASSTPESLDGLLNDPAVKKAGLLEDLVGGGQPHGPSQVIREDPIDILMNSDTRDAEDPILGEIPAPLEDDTGPTISDASSPIQDGISPQRRAGPLIPDDWDEAFSDPDPGAKIPDQPPEIADPDPVSEPAIPADAQQAVPRPAVREPDAGATDTALETQAGNHDAARAFFRGVRAEDLNIPDEDLAESMERIGEMVFTLISGIREILMTRSSIKSEFRINQTMIAAGGNNPLKFSPSSEYAVEFLLKPGAKGYLDGRTAVNEALNDIKAHEVAMVTGMQAAIKDVLARLDPKVLEQKVVGGSGFSDLLKGRKSRYWESYEKLYAEISEQAEHEFHEFFSKEFAKAYQKQLERLK